MRMREIEEKLARAEAGASDIGLPEPVRKNFAEFPATNGKPASRHDDLMVVYRDEASHGLRATYYDNEGHTIPYAVTASAGNVVFLSDGPATAMRFRMTYSATAPGQVKIKFELAPPGKDFSTYIEAAAHRDPVPPSAATPSKL